MCVLSPRECRVAASFKVRKCGGVDKCLCAAKTDTRRHLRTASGGADASASCYGVGVLRSWKIIWRNNKKKKLTEASHVPKRGPMAGELNR